MSQRRQHSGAHGSRSAAAGRSRRGSASARSLDEARSALALRMRERVPALEAAIATRSHAISNPREVSDPKYPQGLHAAISVAVDHAISAIELGKRSTLDVPPELTAQARLAARAGVSLDAVLRRYFAINALFDDALAEEAEGIGIPSADVRRLLRAQATLFDRLLATVSSEHAREAESRPTNAAERRRECVKRLLAGEMVDHSELGYDLDAHHLAMMAKGEGARELMGELAGRLDRRLLAVCREEEPIWACWLGGRRALGTEEALRALEGISRGQELVTVGEPGEGLSGWRFSHRQAKAALSIAERGGRPTVRYADVAVLASIVNDDLIATSLRQLYLAPLERMRDGGETARQTLRAYFAAERNISSTAAVLGIDRSTVRNRIRTIEELYGRPFKAFATDLETALRLDD